jgi:hypothetical protein
LTVTEIVGQVVLRMSPLIGDLINLIPLIAPKGVEMPTVTATAPPGAVKFETVLGWAKWVSLGLCVLGLIAAGGLMAIQSRRGDGGEHLGRIVVVLFGVVIISAAAAMVGWLA